MTLHSHYTAEHKINRCSSSSWRFTDDILYPFGSNIFFPLFPFYFYTYKKKKEILVQPGQYYFQKTSIYTFIRVLSIKTRNNRAYKVSFCIFHVSFRIIRLVGESCNRIKRDPSLYVPRDTRTT